MSDDDKTKPDARPYDAQEREDVWTAIDNLQSAISTIKNELADYMSEEGVKRLDDCIDTIVQML